MTTLAELDADGDGDLHYSDFLAAMMAVQLDTCEDEHLLREAAVGRCHGD